MAQKKAEVSTAPYRPTAQEVREWDEQQRQNYDLAETAFKQMRDVTSTTVKSTPTFNKEQLRTYLRNISRNEVNLRNLSRFLFYRCHPYYRLIMYNANMFALEARSVIPNYDMTQTNNKQKMVKEYYETLKLLDRMNLQYEFLKVYTVNFREDVYYGVVYFDDTGMFFYQLDPDYCKIDGYDTTGGFTYSMDMSYFRQRQTMLEFLGEPFTSMYRAYDGDSSRRWQHMPEEYAVCLKARAEDPETVVPPFSGLFEAIINLIDLEDIQAIADAEQIYKMIWLEMETITNTQMADDWRVNPQLMIKYFNRMVNEALPDYVSAAIIPGKLNAISFDNDQSTDTNKVSKSTETLFNTSGGAQILNSSTISGTTAFNAAIKADTEFAISMLLPQTELWVNRFLSYHAKNPCKVKFFEVSTYTKDALKKELLQAAEYGIPTRLAYNNLNGFSELDTMALNFLEIECLNLHEVFLPVNSTHTQGNSDVGAPTKDDTELTDDGEASRDKTDRAKG